MCIFNNTFCSYDEWSFVRVYLLFYCSRKLQWFVLEILLFFVFTRKKAQYENIDADIVQGEEEPQIDDEKGDNLCGLSW